MTITIVPELDERGTTQRFRARGGEQEATGITAGAALDALSSQINEADDVSGTLVIIQRFRSDKFFNKEQQARLGELMQKLRNARSKGNTLPQEEQAELDALIEAELLATIKRSEALLGIGSK